MQRFRVLTNDGEVKHWKGDYAIRCDYVKSSYKRRAWTQNWFLILWNSLMDKFAGISRFGKKTENKFWAKSTMISSCSHKPLFALHMHLTQAHNRFHIISKIKANLWLVCFFLFAQVHHKTNRDKFCVWRRHTNEFSILPKINGNSHKFVHLASTKTANQFFVKTSAFNNYYPLFLEVKQQLQTTGDSSAKVRARSQSLQTSKSSF